MSIDEIEELLEDYDDVVCALSDALDRWPDDATTKNLKVELEKICKAVGDRVESLEDEATKG